MLNPDAYCGGVVSCYGNESVCSVADTERKKKVGFELFFKFFLFIQGNASPPQERLWHVVNSVHSEYC